MDIQIWTKSLLKSYNMLPNIAERLNRKVDILALSFPSINYGNTTENVANKILKCVDKKVTLCKTKVLIENILMKLNNKYATVLKMKYLDNMSYEQIASYFGVCERTIRRYIVEAIKNFSYHLEKQNYTAETLSNIYKNEYWMCCIYLSILKHMVKYEKAEELKKISTTTKNCSLIYSFKIN